MFGFVVPRSVVRQKSRERGQGAAYLMTAKKKSKKERRVKNKEENEKEEGEEKVGEEEEEKIEKREEKREDQMSMTHSLQPGPTSS